MYGIKTLAQSESKTGWLYSLDPRVKLIYLIYFSVFSMLLDSLWSLSCFFGISVFVVLSIMPDKARLKIMLVMAVLVTWGTVFSQAIFYYAQPRTVLFEIIGPNTFLLGPLLGPVNFYLEGMEYGAIQSMRFTFMMFLGLSFCWTTDTSAMFRALTGLKVSFVLGFMTVTAIRFLPVLIDEFSMVILAHRMRKGSVLSFNPFKILSNWLSITRPVLINCYRRSSVLALSIQGRAFSPDLKFDSSLETPLSLNEKALLSLGGIITLSAVVAKLLYWLYLAGLFYNLNLRPVYEFCRLYL